MPRLTTVAIALTLLLLTCGCAPEATPAATDQVATEGKGLSEKEKIEALIKHVEGLSDAVFIRNGSEYDAKTAAKFLRGKWDREPDIKTAKEFIDKLASASSTSGKPYLIRFKDGKEVKSGDYLKAELARIEKGERKP
jgi:hypothetical protein